MSRLKKFLKLFGPGFITGASDDDPSGIGTYAQTGAKFGFHQTWTVIFAFPFMVAVQEMCGRIGLVTGKGLAAVVRSHYGKPVLYSAVLLLTIANVINIGADLGAMAASAQLVFGIPFYLWLGIITVVTLLLVVLFPYRSYVHFLKWLAISLFAYLFTALIVKPDWWAVIGAALSPTIIYSKEFLMNIVAVLGTTISPYLFFWQTSEEVEEKIMHNKITADGKSIMGKTDVRDMRWDTFIGMFFSNLIAFFIMVTAAATLHANGITSIETADQAALALRPLAGDLAYLLFAVGIIATGLLAVPVLAGSASYAISEVFGWKEGLYRSFHQARAFYLVIICATLVGLVVNVIGIPPFTMLYYTAVLNGIAAPPLIVLILLVANNRKIMGKHVNSWVSNLLGWAIALIMGTAGISLVASLF